ncbi:MAG: 50S ribosomal protein L21 [Chlorobiaceae bacterium]|nr:50S ribosomal protein L21 [Chlorobiaceae bacterium]NTV25141.1 50S ribosomal protein L21 [Chlorobiaceae bacterium]
MQALIEISDKQYLVKQGDKLFVPRQDAAAGDVFEVKPLMHVAEEQSSLEPAGTVKVKVLDHVRDEKVVVFRKNRRKRFQKRNGHRQHMTQVEVLSL